ncbi:hypothetical protein SAMN05444159_1289 [Bradyrhizobium lablabi]|uniref:Uncharacterized protein n=1 Tax=Bradyrhizobium lablabi TaxID=722472 RepID=A0A1M6LIW2_9BRAD|nr:hypothetical protein [Bradyrhizobium lablabi]SHJ71124.1 hypothetical protein SAMN05444159_1289 [Bradyrhizobium lablabi]
MSEKPSEAQVAALVEAMDQLLDDMGPNGQSVCLAAKAQARIAFDPFLDPECVEFIMPLEQAKRVILECE